MSAFKQDPLNTISPETLSPTIEVAGRECEKPYVMFYVQID